MEGKIKIVAGLLVLAVLVHWVTRAPSTELELPSPAADAVAEESRTAIEGKVVPEGKGDARGVGEAQRTQVPMDSADEAASSMPQGSRVLRVIVDEISEEEAQQLEITIRGHDADGIWLSKVQESWRGQGIVSHYDLTPFFVAIAQSYPNRSMTEMRVIVGHPERLSESVRIKVNEGQQTLKGQTLYEARVQFAPLVFWSEFELTVRDAHTREHLENVELHMVPSSFMGIWKQPGRSHPYTEIGTGLTSPITMVGGRRATGDESRVGGIALPDALGRAGSIAELAQPVRAERGVVIFAGAPGYAWSSVPIDVSSDADREILLEAGASLGVRLGNVKLEDYAELSDDTQLYVVKLREGGGHSFVSVLPLDETLKEDGLWLEGLEAGDYAASVEIGAVFAWQDRHVLAQEEVSLAAGESRDIFLHLEDVPEPPSLATLGGTIEIPEYEGLSDVQLHVYAADFQYGEPDVKLFLSEMQQVAGSPPTWRFEIDDLPAGIYQLMLSPFQKSWMVELPNEGRDDVALEIDELAEVIVETIDRDSGDRVPMVTLRYGLLEDLDGQVSRSGGMVLFDGEPGRFRFWTAPGEAFMTTYGVPNDLPYGLQRKELTLTSGPQTVPFEVARVTALTFEFRDEGKALPHADQVYYDVLRTVSAVGHEGSAVGIATGYVELGAAGSYEISFEGVGTDRFVPIPAQHVQVRAGETQHIVVNLQRK